MSWPIASAVSWGGVGCRASSGGGAGGTVRMLAPEPGGAEDFATSSSCAGSTPPRMKMFILRRRLVQAKKVGLTLVPRVRHQFDLGALWHHRLLPPAGRARRVESLMWGIPLGNHAH